MKKIKDCLKWTIHMGFTFLKDYYSVFIISFLCLFTVEIMNHPTEGIWNVISWFHTNTRAMLMNYLIYLSINFIFYLIINRLNIANIAFFIALNALGMVNYNKLILKGENLVFWDMFQAVDAAKAVTETHLEINWQIVFVVLMMVLVALWQILGHRQRRKGTFRIRAFLLCAVVLSFITVGVLFNDDTLNRLYLTNYDWNYDQNYKENGFILCYIMNLQNAVISKPEGYSEKEVEEAVENIKTVVDEADLSYTSEDIENPNIVVIMCESFSDITVANDGIEFDEDIMPNIHATNDNVIKGYIVTSIFGGGTANSEFEFLTGNSCAFLPTGSVAYNTYVEEDTDSIIQILKDRGYETIAVHPYDREFYHRCDIYSYFGFDDFITEEYFAEDAERKKGYISDHEVYKMIISQFEQKDEDTPFFNFTVTMENHTPYTDTTNGVIGVKYDETKYVSSKIEQVGVHAKGVKDGDALFGELKDYFSQVDEPTIVVLFGDHHPYISNTVNQNSSNLNEQTKFYTPYIIWANYEIETKTDYIIPSSTLSSVVLTAANIEIPDYLKYNLYGTTILSGYNPYYVLDRSENYYTYHDDLSEEIQTFLNNKEIVQYDNLFGEKYSRDELWNVTQEEGEVENES